MAAVLATVTHQTHSKVATRTPPYGDRRLAPAAGLRPASMLEPWPQGKVERHSGMGYELVQALDAPVLQMEEQLPNVLQFFVTSVPAVAEQVINVPEISHDRTQQRLTDSLRQPQTAEQLVEVPTIVSYSSLQGIEEQNADIPVPPGRGGSGRGGGGLRGFLFLPGQSYSLSSEQIIDNPVPRGRGDQGGFQGFP